MRKYLIALLLLCASSVQAQTIADKLATINSIKLDIKAALASKSQTVGDDFSVYDDVIASMQVGIAASFTVESVTAGEDITGRNFVCIQGSNPWIPIATYTTGYPSGQPIVVAALSMSKDGNFLVCAHQGTVTPKYIISYKYDSLTNSFLPTASASAQLTESGRNSALNRDGTRLVCSSKTSGEGKLQIYLWNAGNNRYELATAPSDIAGGDYGLAVSADGSKMAANYYNGSAAAPPYLKTYIWDDAAGRYQLATAPDAVINGRYFGNAFTETGDRLVCGTDVSPYIISYDWDAVDGRYEKASATTHDINPSGVVYGVACSSNGDYMAAGVGTSKYLVTYKYDAAKKQYIQMPEVDSPPDGVCNSVSMSDDGKYLVVSGVFTNPNKYIALYRLDKTTNTYIYSRSTDSDPVGTVVLSCGISGDGTRIAGMSQTAPYLAIYNVMNSYSDWAAYNIIGMPFKNMFMLGWFDSDVTSGSSDTFKGLWELDDFAGYGD